MCKVYYKAYYNVDLINLLDITLFNTYNKLALKVKQGIKMVCENDKLVLSATDLEMSVEKTIRAEVESSGETVVPGRLFGEYIKYKKENRTC